MATLRDIKKLIRSVILTRQITSTMMMVAAAKLRRTQTTAEQTRPYADGVAGMAQSLARCAIDQNLHPFYRPVPVGAKDQKDSQSRQKLKRLLVVFTSDRGLCGAFNTNVIKKAEKWLEDFEEKSEEENGEKIAGTQLGDSGQAGEQKTVTKQVRGEVELVCVGRRGERHFLREEKNIARSFDTLDVTFSAESFRKLLAACRGVDLASPLTAITADHTIEEDQKTKLAPFHGLVDYLVRRFLGAETIDPGTGDVQPGVMVDEIVLVYNGFISAAHSLVKLDKFLNISDATDDNESAEKKSSAAKSLVPHIYEPDTKAVLDELMPLYAFYRIWAAAADSQASEQAMRVVAMTTATELADEMVGDLTLQYNKARQAAITKEILEVNTGAEALRT